jgi:hypothetical protein
LHKIRCVQKGVFPISCNGNYTMGGSGKTVGAPTPNEPQMNREGLTSSRGSPPKSF